MDKKLVSYFVAGAVIAVASLGVSASLEVVLFATLVGPAVLLLTVAVLRHNARL